MADAEPLRTKDELIEAMAREFLTAKWQGEWEDFAALQREAFSAGARAVWPLIVEFVAHWLDDASCEDFALDTPPAQIWREEMT